MSDPNKLRLCKSVSVIQTHVHIFANIQPLSVCDVFQETALPWAMTLASILEQPEGVDKREELSCFKNNFSRNFTGQN